MERIIFTALVFTASGGLAAKHVFISEKMSWVDAQDSCRKHFIDLSPVSNYVEKLLFRQSVSDDQTGWVGLYWDLTDQEWKWSGGVAAKNQSSINDQLDTWEGLFWNGFKFISKDLETTNNFFCLNLVVAQEEKTWEEALEHCRDNHSDFTSLLSDTENLLAKNQIQDSTITQRVWLGLRFLGDTWLWVNGDPLRYQAWTQTGDPDQQSPVWKRCGALTKQGEWENRDCQERLNFICA